MSSRVPLPPGHYYPFGSLSRQSLTQADWSAILSGLVYQLEDEFVASELLQLADDLSILAHNLRARYAPDGTGRESPPLA